MKAKDLRGKPVVAIGNAQRLGKVEEMLIDTDLQRVVAIELDSRATGETNIIPVDMIRAIGSDAITVETSGVAQAGGPSGRGRLEGGEAIETLSDLLGSRVLTHGGDHIGDIADVDFNPSSFQITAYELTTGPLSGVMGRHRMLQAIPGIHFGRKLVTVPDSAYAEPAQEHPPSGAAERHRAGHGV